MYAQYTIVHYNHTIPNSHNQNGGVWSKLISIRTEMLCCECPGNYACKHQTREQKRKKAQAHCCIQEDSWVDTTENMALSTSNCIASFRMPNQIKGHKSIEMLRTDTSICLWRFKKAPIITSSGNSALFASCNMCLYDSFSLDVKYLVVISILHKRKQYSYLLKYSWAQPSPF